jgi:DNA-binding GntR family transcriptional regulator
VYEFKKKFLDGKNGKIGMLMKEMKNIPPEERAAYGKCVNELKEWALSFLGDLDVKMKENKLYDEVWIMSSVILNTVSTVDAVCNALEHDILSLRFAPGEKITESEIAARYGVSRNTVREAVAHLLAQGFLTKIANKGVYVRKFTSEDVQEIFHLRAMLETEAVNAILSGDDLPSHLYKTVEEMESIARRDQWDEYVLADIRFHSALVAAAGSPRLSRLYDTILTEVKLCIYQTRNYVAVPDHNNASHRAILDAICSRNRKESLALLKSHIEHVIKRYCAGLIAMDHHQ